MSKGGILWSRGEKKRKVDLTIFPESGRTKESVLGESFEDGKELEASATREGFDRAQGTQIQGRRDVIEGRERTIN